MQKQKIYLNEKNYPTSQYMFSFMKNVKFYDLKNVSHDFLLRNRVSLDTYNKLNHLKTKHKKSKSLRRSRKTNKEKYKQSLRKKIKNDVLVDYIFNAYNMNYGSLPIHGQYVLPIIGDDDNKGELINHCIEHGIADQCHVFEMPFKKFHDIHESSQEFKQIKGDNHNVCASYDMIDNFIANCCIDSCFAPLSKIKNNHQVSYHGHYYTYLGMSNDDVMLLKMKFR